MKSFVRNCVVLMFDKFIYDIPSEEKQTIWENVIDYVRKANMIHKVIDGAKAIVIVNVCIDDILDIVSDKTIRSFDVIDFNKDGSKKLIHYELDDMFFSKKGRIIQERLERGIFTKPNVKYYAQTTQKATGSKISTDISGFVAAYNSHIISYLNTTDETEGDIMLRIDWSLDPRLTKSARWEKRGCMRIAFGKIMNAHAPNAL